MTDRLELLRDYKPPAGRFDELLAPDGSIRPHWQPMLSALQRMGQQGIDSCRRTGEAIIRENGITYNVYGDPRGIDRLWALDLLPVVLPSEEWAYIEQGVEQRLRLLNAIQEDLYGPQRLLRDSGLPPEFVHANPRYLRSCHGIVPKRSGYLIRYAADLVRDETGRWRVFSDRTQAPSGAGYALENRIVTSRVFPNAIAEMRVRRLAGFFRSFRSALRATDPNEREEPTVVLLTPGPHNETYFEHVYLARYLGYSMLEGGELACRDNRLFVRTIKGLKQVDVVLRRVDDIYCDPLELLPNSTLGTTGLLQAFRMGNVSICNAIGAGVLEVPALKAVLPQLCKRLGSSELLLPPTRTLWGALPEDRAEMEARWDELKLQPAFGAVSSAAFTGVAANDRDLQRQLWRHRPYLYSAGEEPRPSTMPLLAEDQLTPAKLVLRVFAVYDPERDSVHVMPGGMARFGQSDSLSDITMQQGSGSKDVWITSGDPVDFSSLLSVESESTTLVRSPENISSRLAENLLWLGRYCERGEYIVRFLRHVLMRYTDEEALEDTSALAPLLHAGAVILQPDVTTPIDRPASADILYDVQNALLEALYSEGHPTGVIQNLYAIRRAAWIVRERFSEDDWRILIGLIDQFLNQDDENKSLRGAMESLNQLVTGFVAFSGLIAENMTREPGQIFIDMGRRIERALNVTDLLLGTLTRPTAGESLLLHSLLAICDSPMTYRGRYGAKVRTGPVFDLLVSDETNPRSVSYQLTALARHLARLPKRGEPGLLNTEERIIERLRSAVRIANVNTLAGVGEDGQRKGMRKLLKDLSESLPEFANQISRRYFIHTAAARQLGGSVEEDHA
ncbi:MAG: hypothetical protein GC168_01085 [Candidatus Hydrogenedens sp.]|nr:hypothetical protein [Candidatus Hydrogenedens sp.]